jgi:hypothetical protein
VEKRHTARKAQHKKRQVAKRDHNDNRINRRKAGELGVSSDEDPRPSRCGVEMSPVPQSTGATCWGHPRRRPLAALKCRRRASRKRPCATRPWARARNSWLAPPERTSGRSALVSRPAGRAPLSRRDPHRTEPTLQDDRRSGRHPPASFTMAPTAPPLTPCRGTDHRGSHRTRCRRRAHHRQWSQALPHGICSHCLFGVAGPRMYMCPSCRWGPQFNPSRCGGHGVSPRAGGGACCCR